MISHRFIHRLAGRSSAGFRSVGRTFAVAALSSEHPHQSLSQTPHGSQAMSENSKAQTRVLNSVVPSSVGSLGLKSQFSEAKSFLGTMYFRRFMHSAAPNEFEKETDTRPAEIQIEPKPYETNGNARPTDMFRNIRNIEMERTPGSFGPPGKRWNRAIEGNTGPFEMRNNTGTLNNDMNARPNDFFRSFRPREMELNNRNTGPFETGLGTRTTERNTRLFDPNGRPTESNIKPLQFDRETRSMNFARGILEENGRDYFGGNRFSRHTIEQNADIVHIKLMRNNAYVTVTDSKGNRKVGASGGLLSAMKGGPKVSRYSAEATAEHVGRLAKDMGLKSVVVKVNGFTYFKKKKQAVLSFRDGYTHSRSDQNPIVYIEDTTRRAHNGCRLRKQRRV